jgi:hypothetical protein
MDRDESMRIVAIHAKNTIESLIDEVATLEGSLNEARAALDAERQRNEALSTQQGRGECARCARHEQTPSRGTETLASALVSNLRTELRTTRAREAASRAEAVEATLLADAAETRVRELGEQLRDAQREAARGQEAAEDVLELRRLLDEAHATIAAREADLAELESVAQRAAEEAELARSELDNVLVSTALEDRKRKRAQDHWKALADR